MAVSLDNEVDAALAEIEEKYSSTNKLSKHKVPDFAIHLLQQFDALGLTGDGDDIFTQVVVNASALVNMYIKSMGKLQDYNLDLIRCDSINKQLKKRNDVYKQELKAKDDLIEFLNAELVLLRSESEGCCKENLKLQREVQNVVRAQCKKNCEHEFKKLNIENQKLKNKLENNVGNYVSADMVVANIVRIYKANEEIYKGTIKQLEDNNQKLLEDILKLKDDIAVTLFDKTSIN